MENQAKNQEIEGAVLTGGEGRVLRGAPGASYGVPLARPAGAAGASCGDEAARPAGGRRRVLRGRGMQRRDLWGMQRHVSLGRKKVRRERRGIGGERSRWVK
jgi:hypothetical protein